MWRLVVSKACMEEVISPSTEGQVLLNLQLVLSWLIETIPIAQRGSQLTAHQLATVLVEIRGVYEMTKFTVFIGGRRSRFALELTLMIASLLLAGATATMQAEAQIANGQAENRRSRKFCRPSALICHRRFISRLAE